MKKYTYQAKTFEEAKTLAMTELMEQENNLYIKEIEKTNKLFNFKINTCICVIFFLYTS